MSTIEGRIRFEKTVDAYRVREEPSGHSLGTVAKNRNLWYCASINYASATLPEGFFATRHAAGEALVDARDAAREEYEENQTRDRNVPLGLLQALVRYCRADGSVHDVEQIGENAFRVRMTQRLFGDGEEYVLDRKGELVRDEALFEEGDEVVFRDGTDGADDRSGSGPGGKVIGEVLAVVDGKVGVDFSRALNRGSEYARTLVGDEVVDGIPASQLEKVS
jgi:hypothetical protein